MSFLDDLIARLFPGSPAKPAALETQASDRKLHREKLPELKDLPDATESEVIVRQILREAKHAMMRDKYRYNLADSPRWRALKSESASRQISVMLAAVYQRPKGGSVAGMEAINIEQARTAMVSQILRRDLPFKEEQLFELLQLWGAQRYLTWGIPGTALLGALERLSGRQDLSAPTIKLLTDIKNKALGTGPYGWGPNKETKEIGNRISRLLEPSNRTAPTLPDGTFAKHASALLDSLSDPSPWLHLLLLAGEAGDKAKPTGKWLAAMTTVLGEIDASAVADRIIQWLAETVPDPADVDASLDVLKGLIWVSVRLDHATMAGPLGRFAELCYRKVPGVGPRSVKLGNAALWALSDMANEPRAAAELIRLREKIKYPSARSAIDNRLGEMASKAGQSVQALEDLSLPNFGLGNDGRLERIFGTARVQLEVSANDVAVRWFNAAGAEVKSIPADVKRDHAAGLTAFRSALKDIESARAGQVVRLEQSWVENRDWAFDDWKTHFLAHPLRRPIAESLIWRIDGESGAFAVMASGTIVADVRGEAIAVPAGARVRLWHPLDAAPAEVLAWRRRIVDSGATQPIKQAHREIYVLTDAERQTRVYSNRFAAHILRQHQFRALCQARGWTYGLMGAWDSWNLPQKVLPAHGLTAQYHVEVVDNGQRTEAWVPLHIASDQVRFVNGRSESVPLDDVPPVVFSEVLRDVDLFVAVTSVANDPNWTDGGPDGRFGGYWTQWAFGDLGQSAQTRRELIATIAPRLSIRDKLEITEKFLVVEGKRQKYAIHFGSGNIQILPANRYLCIVPDRPPLETEKLRLPFAGDSLLSIILSKAFLLVDESRIKDETILRQL